MSYKDFSTFCPKAIAGIGKLPNTVTDRSIPIRLKRAASGEVMERFRLRDVTPEADALRSRLEQWAEGAVDVLHDARPALPDELSDRQQDGVEPLLAIADVAGKGWPAIARAAIVGICTEARQADDSIGARLLGDIRQVFELRKVDKIPSLELADALALIETSPWAEWSHGKPLTAPKLARLLRPFEVASRKIRIGDKTPWGYDLADFEDSFKRYLPPLTSPSTSKTEHPEQTNVYAGNLSLFVPEQNLDVPLSKQAKSAVFMRVVPDVPDSTATTGMEGKGAA